jgi:hypothetical protein
MLVIGDQSWLSMKTPFLFKWLLFRRISIASFTRRSTYPHILCNTGRFIMFSVITNIYNKKIKGPTLMELFTATGNFFLLLLTTRDVRCVHHGWHGTHPYSIQDVATHASTCWRLCGNNLNILSMCAVSPVVHTSNISSRQKNFFNFPVAVKNSITVGPLVFLL